MARAYIRPPGVTITETTQAGINPIIATPDLLCLVGPASGSVTVTEAVTLSGTTASSLKGVKATDLMTPTSITFVADYDSSSAQSSNAAYTSNGGYIPGSYTFNATDHTIARVASVTSIPLADTTLSATATTMTATASVLSPFPSTGGAVIVDNEQIQYTSATLNAGTITFTGLTRGANNTTAAVHTAASSQVKYGFVIPDNRQVYVTYTYTPSDYFTPYYVSGNDFSNIETRFGKAIADDGVTVNSPLTLAAKIAIENGAQDLVLQPLFYNTEDITGPMPTRTQPANSDSINTSNTWNKTFRALQNEENIGIIVPVIGQNATYNYGTGSSSVLNDTAQLNIFQSLQGHIAFMDSNYDQLIIGVIGEDSTNPPSGSTYASRDTVRSHLISLQAYTSNNTSFNERMVFIAQTKFERPSTASATTSVILGGQYAAAAVAGKVVSYEPQISLTRKTLAGFKKIVDTSTKPQKTQDSGVGLFVIEQNKNDNSIFVRHALTTDKTSVAKAELNAIRAKHYMIRSLRQTIDTQVIGSTIADDSAPLTIATTIASTLRTLQDDGVIVQFDSVQGQFDSIDPTQIGIRFNYRPAFAVNYVNIKFAVDLTSGITSVTTTNQTNIGA